MTTDHMELRAIANEGPTSVEHVLVLRIALVELLADYDALVAAGTKSKKSTGYSDEFEAAWDIYPVRPGNSKAAAYKAWKARLTSGATALEMIEGTRKYAVYCKAEGTEPQFVKQAATFFGPGEHFSADWTPRTQQRRLLADRRDPNQLAQVQADANAEAKRRLFGDVPQNQDWRTIDAT